MTTRVAPIPVADPAALREHRVVDDPRRAQFRLRRSDSSEWSERRIMRNGHSAHRGPVRGPSACKRYRGVFSCTLAQAFGQTCLRSQPDFALPTVPPVRSVRRTTALDPSTRIATRSIEGLSRQPASRPPPPDPLGSCEHRVGDNPPLAPLPPPTNSSSSSPRPLILPDYPSHRP